MDSLPSVSTSAVLLPLRRHNHHHRRRQSPLFSTYIKSLDQIRLNSSSIAFNSREFCRLKRSMKVQCKLSGEEEEEEENDRRDEDELDRALRMNGAIPRSSDEFVKQVSSRAYDMRRNLQQTFDTSSYDVLEANPWREKSKSVYVLTHQENQLCTMKTRRDRSEVEQELGFLFSKGEKLRNQSKKSETSTKFHMLVEDVREGVLVFEDQNEAARYCDLLQGGGQECEAVAEVEASSVFDICQKNRALVVFFRRGRTPPQPEHLKLNLRARNRSLEDQED